MFFKNRLSMMFGLIVIALASSVTMPALAGTIRVTASVLNVRSGPSTSNAQIGRIREGQKYVSARVSGAWHQIDYDNRKGWIHGNYVQADSANYLEVRVSSSLNVRSGPGTGYRDIGDTLNGQRWVVNKSSGDWLRVNFAGGAFWMHNNYLVPPGTISDPNQPTLPVSGAGLVQLPNRGNGYYGYGPDFKRWGSTTMGYGLIRAADRRYRDNSNLPRIGVGNLSLSSGGTPSPHKSHKNGRRADIRPLGSIEGAMTVSSRQYSRERTRDWISHYLRGEFSGLLSSILFNDQTLINEGLTTFYRGHHNHMHVTTSR